MIAPRKTAEVTQKRRHASPGADFEQGRVSEASARPECCRMGKFDQSDRVTGNLVVVEEVSKGLAQEEVPVPAGSFKQVRSRIDLQRLWEIESGSVKRMIECKKNAN